MTTQTVRIGIVGAGANTRLRHVPGFRAIVGVEIVGVVNSSPESTDRAAQEFEIPRTYANWLELIADDDIDAVMIGTWPNLHCEVTCAALEAGKHVLTEARMARNAAEARKMLECSRRHADLVAQIVPSPFGLAEYDFVTDLIADGFLGELRELVVLGATDIFYDNTKRLHWRQEREISGVNTLALGILHEAALRFVPAPTRVFAQSRICDATRPTDDGGTVQATVPDSVQIVTELEGGARGMYHLSGICLFGPGQQIHLFGSRGTIKLEFAAETKLWIGEAGDADMQLAEIPANKRGGWRVEAEFVGAIRGEEPVRFSDFETGVKYMEFTEAVHQSTQRAHPVALPLERQ
jgi:predicted dehydrogenase